MGGEPPVVRAVSERASRGPALPALLLALVLGCSDGDTTAPPAAGIMADWLEIVDGGSGAVAELIDAGAPPGGDGPAVAVSPSNPFVAGGSADLRVTVAAPDSIDGLLLAVDGSRGYVALDLGALRTSTSVRVTLRAPPAARDFVLRVAGRLRGATGPWSDLSIAPVDVEHGPVEFALSWDTGADLDLHVVEPGDTEIHPADPVAASGGEMDLIAQGCTQTGPSSEHIVWGTDDAPPRGQYVVRIAFAAACGATETDWILTMRAPGQRTRVLSGTISGDPGGGGAGAGNAVGRLTY